MKQPPVKPIVLTLLSSFVIGMALFQSGCALDMGTGSNGAVLSPGTASRLESDAMVALHQLYSQQPAAKKLGHKAKAILVFPDVLKGGFMVGAQLGNGVLFQNGRTMGYYNTVGASYGYQVGLQSYGYVLFLMNDAALAHLNDTGGWEIGTGPSIAILDAGMAKNISTTTLQKDIYAIIFNQTGLMAGVGLQGSKITMIQQ
jgi:lipid-binding SYLF domain-containing protein